MGLKYHLGHTGNVVRDPRTRFYLTKSSIQLNKLADKASAIDNIEHKLRTMREDPINGDLMQQKWLRTNDLNAKRLKRVARRRP